jgi:hypothetical protein
MERDTTATAMELEDLELPILLVATMEAPLTTITEVPAEHKPTPPTQTMVVDIHGSKILITTAGSL